ncbi:MAG TPA: hypothetical protein VIO60_09125 [Rectinemataceae bacterium]
MNCRLCGLVAASILLLSQLQGQESQVGADEGAIACTAEVTASVTGIHLPTTGQSLGSAVELNLGLEGGSSAHIRASIRAAIFQGAAVLPLWTSLGASASGSIGIFTAPAFDPATPAPDWLALLSLDELGLSWSGGALEAEAGLGFANWGLGKAFSPADFFSEIDSSSALPRRKSALIGRISWFPSQLWRIDIVGSPMAAPSIGGGRGSLLAARAYGLVSESLLLAASLGWKDPTDSSPQIIGALEASIDAGWLTPYAELAASSPLDGALNRDIGWKLLAGLSAAFPGAAFAAEYLFSPETEKIHAVFGSAALKLDEWNSVSASAIFAPGSGSGTASLGLDSESLPGLRLGISGSASRSLLGSWSFNLIVSVRSRI